MFFASMGANKRKPDPNQRSKRIESGSVGEEEYESLYAQYFPQIGRLNFSPQVSEIISSLLKCTRVHCVKKGCQTNSEKWP